MRPDWTYVGWWRETLIERLQGGPDLLTKLSPEDFGGGRRGNWVSIREIEQYMCSVADCGERAHASWSGCADQNINRPLCPEHDVQINLLALIWWGDPDWEEKMEKYVLDMEVDIERKVASWAYAEQPLYEMLLRRMEGRPLLQPLDNPPNRVHSQEKAPVRSGETIKG